MTVDPAELRVYVLDRHLRAVGGERPDLLLAALLVDEPDVDGCQRRVGLAGLSVYVCQVVGYGCGARSTASRARCRGGARGRARAAACTGRARAAAATAAAAAAGQR